MTEISFVSLNSFSILSQDESNIIGGAELQQAIIAQGLMKRGYNVSFITYDFENKSAILDNGIKIFTTYKRNESSEYSILKKIYILWKKMKECNSDIYYYHCGSPAIVAIFAKIHKKKFVKHISSNAEVKGKSIVKNNYFFTLLLRLSYFIEFKFANIVISQNQFQKEKLKKKFNIDSIIIKNAIIIDNKINKKIKTNKNKKYILWVGTIRDIKQPQLFIDIAKVLPKYNFLMIGGIGENRSLYKSIKESADHLDNLTFKGFIPHKKIFQYYEQSFILINTSKTEGFPNTFLEAWINEIPVITLNFDPDGIISNKKLGVHSKNYNNLIKNIKQLMEDKTLREKLGRNGFNYIKEEHDRDAIIDKIDQLFQNL